MPELVRSAYWSATEDPHRIAHRRMYTEREQEAFPHVYNHKLILVAAENAYGKAVTRVVLEGWSAERATDELIARIKGLAG
jgi:multiple sugar transport system substrate-binding protein